VIAETWDEEDPLFVKKVMKDLIKREKILVCLVNVFTRQNRLQWSIGCSEDIDFPFDEIKDELFSQIDGKGGGRSPMWQGSGTKPAAAADLPAVFKKLAAAAALK
jgi:alanyl-tRNA synthetase